MANLATRLVFTALIALAALGPTPAAALPHCTDLAPLLFADPTILAATSAITPAAGATPAYCQVNLTQFHAINIRVGLPLSAADGGAGGVQGAWNGKIQNLGGGGFAGNVGAVTGPVTNRYVGSSTDTGHSAAWCNANSQPNCGSAGGGFVLDKNNQLIPWQVTDFITDSLHAQTVRALALAKSYYGMDAARNYWNGCSTGGRQGLELAQKFGDLFDGFLVGAPAMNWNRFQIGEVWPAVAMKDLTASAGVSPAKSNAANAAAVAACDGDDGVVDGLVSEPRRCAFDASSLICTGGPGDPATCLTPPEAETINRIWDGPREPGGGRLWGGLTRGTGFGTLLPGGTNASPLPLTYVQNWVHEDPAFDWRQITLSGFEPEFRFSEWKFRSTAATDDPDLDTVKARNGKIIHYHGIADPLIVPFGSYNYVSRVFARYGVAGTQPFMRSFFYPGNGHCGGGNAPLINGTDLFTALVNWVENGMAPDYIVARQNLGGGVMRTRKICKYPDEAVYNGSGSTDDEASFHCAVNAAEPVDLAAASVTARQELGEEAAATIWVGLKNSDDVGTRFDVRAELYSGHTLVAAGESRCIVGVSRNPSAAKEVTIPLLPIAGASIAAQDRLALKVLARIGTNADGIKCAGHASAAGLRLYYDGAKQPAGFRTGLAPEAVADFFLHSSNALHFPTTTPPASPTAKFKDSQSVSVAKGNPWQVVGTWQE
jgi:feruloyl esterase